MSERFLKVMLIAALLLVMLAVALIAAAGFWFVWSDVFVEGIPGKLFASGLIVAILATVGLGLYSDMARQAKQREPGVHNQER